MMHQQAERPRDERFSVMPNAETPGSSSTQDFLPTIPNIRLRETESNLWEVVMTEEERQKQMPILCYVIQIMSYCHLAMYSCMSTPKAWATLWPTKQ